MFFSPKGTRQFQVYLHFIPVKEGKEYTSMVELPASEGGWSIEKSPITSGEYYSYFSLDLRKLPNDVFFPKNAPKIETIIEEKRDFQYICQDITICAKNKPMRKLNTKGTYLHSIFVVESDRYIFLLAQPKEDMRKYEVKAISQALQKAGDESTNTIHILGINDIIASFAVLDYLDRLRNQANYLILVFLKARHTFFDYAKCEVVFGNDEIAKDEFIRIVKHYAPNEQSAKDLEQYFTTFLAQRRDWFNVPIFLDIHHLTVINREGFNDDPLSHLGDVLPPVNKDRIGKRIPMAHSSFRAEAEHNRDPDADEDPYYFDIDKKMQQNPYSMTNPTGITWGDLTQAVIMAKGSKSDWHYELITGVMVEMEEDRMVVGLDFDHGS